MGSGEPKGFSGPFLLEGPVIQVFGTKKCRITQKALRFFKERGVAVQFRDIAEKAPSPGELDDIARGVGGFKALIDENSSEARSRGLPYMDYDPRDELLRNPLLMLTPVVRCGKGTASVGFDEKSWKSFSDSRDSGC
jgi:arsenate reductase-like glutaredoxin family protein